MTDNINEETKSKINSKNLLIKLFLLVILLFIFGVYFIVQKKRENIEASFSEEVKKSDRIEEKTLVEEALDYSTGPKPPANLFKSDVVREKQEKDQIGENNTKAGISEEKSPKDIEQGKDSKEPKVEELLSPDPYEKVMKEESEAFNRSRLKNKFNNYRVFLSNANRLVEKYKSKKLLSIELVIFKDHIHPTYINEIVKLFELYDSLLKKNISAKTIENKKDKLQNEFWQRFVKIKKLDQSSEDQELLAVRQEIDERLSTFVDYVYSQNLQDSLVN
jgi:hypothetical protein